MTFTEPFSPPRFCPLPPCGGHIGPDPIHFVVEEIPAYPLSGEGEHLFLWVEKIGKNTTDVVKAVARAAGIKEREIGFAGMKDKNAVTRQWLSLCRKESDAMSWDLGPGVQILRQERHGNKLRTGHLIGNRFTITLVETGEDAWSRAHAIAAFLKDQGLPNYFGPQRFGHRGKNLTQALSWIFESVRGAPGLEHSSGERTSGERSREDAGSRRRPRKKQGRFENKLLPSVIQSEVFNRYTTQRLSRPEELLLGEVVRLDGTGKSFVVESVEAELPRYRAKDLHRTGPMIGPKGLQAEHAARELEESVCASLGLDQQTLEFLGRHAPGTRRDLMLLPEGLELRQGAAGEIVLSFSLPAGAYATGVLREFTGTDFLSPRENPAEPAVI